MDALNLRDSRISDAGAAAIAEALRANEVLTSIGLRRNNLGDEGKKAIQDAPVSGRGGFKLEM